MPLKRRSSRFWEGILRTPPSTGCQFVTWLPITCTRTKLNSGQVRPRNGAEILVLGPNLRTRIWARAMIGLLKKPLSICQSGWKDFRNVLPVIRWVHSGPRTRITASQTLLTETKLRQRRRLGYPLTFYSPVPINTLTLSEALTSLRTQYNDPSWAWTRTSWYRVQSTNLIIRPPPLSSTDLLLTTTNFNIIHRSS